MKKFLILDEDGFVIGLGKEYKDKVLYKVKVGEWKEANKEKFAKMYPEDRIWKSTFDI